MYQWKLVGGDAMHFIIHHVFFLSKSGKMGLKGRVVLSTILLMMITFLLGNRIIVSSHPRMDSPTPMHRSSDRRNDPFPSSLSNRSVPNRSVPNRSVSTPDASERLHILSELLNISYDIGSSFSQTLQRLKEVVANVGSPPSSRFEAAPNDSSSSCSYHEVVVQDRKVKYVVVTPSEQPLGVLLLIHGCSHTCLDFCHASNECPGCRGLPEEVRFAQFGLAFNMIVIAVSAADKSSHCWSGADVIKGGVMKSPDVENVLTILKKEGVLVPRGSLAQLPLIAMGASSGGTFVGKLAEGALGAQLLGIVVQIAAPPLSDSLYLSPNTVVVYSVMTRDKATARRSKEEFRRIHKKRTGSAIEMENDLAASTSFNGSFFSSSTKVGWCGVNPMRITPLFFSSRISNVSLKASEALHSQLLLRGILSSSEWTIVKDPRHFGGWRNVVAPVLKKIGVKDDLKADKSPISEEMNVGFGYHEFHADFAREMLEFIIKVS